MSTAELGSHSVDGYHDWLAGQGIPVISGLAVNLTTVRTAPWERTGTRAAIVQLEGRGDFCDLQVLDIAPGGSSRPLRQLVEQLVYVVSGNGSTVIETNDGQRRSFEWGRGALFAIPLNTRFQHHNTEGNVYCRLVHYTNMPMVMRLFRDDGFLESSGYDFESRIASETGYRGGGEFLEVREHRHMWRTNYVPSLLSFDELRPSNGRGRGSANIQFWLADGTLGAHMSEIPPGDYKKAHRHMEGFQIIQLSGAGYSLYWTDDGERARVDWGYGVTHAPSAGMWHQHFNVSDTPARYMAFSFGSIRYPYTEARRAYSARLSIGSDQIEYDAEDPEIRAIFDRERAAVARSHAVPADEGRAGS